MGVINLGVLVKKIMGKIAGAGYVKDTDYASSTKGGTIKVDSTYATDITSGGKLKAKEIAAEAYAEANDAAFISKATLDNLITAGAIGGGMTWTKIWEGQASASSEKTFEEGIDALDHKLVIVATYNNSGSTGIGFCLSEMIGSGANTVTLSLNRLNETLSFTLKRTGFTMPSNMGADNLIIYVLD